jgi:hypothetical protein
LLQVDDSQLLATTQPGTEVPVEISYKDEYGQTKSVSYKVKMQSKFHEINLVNVEGVIEFRSDSMAFTGAYVTLGIIVDDDYVLEEGGLIIETLDKSGNLIGPYEGILNELAPDGNLYRKVAFIMPRNRLRISGNVVQLKSGLGALAYKVGSGGAYHPIPGFNQNSHHLTHQLVIKQNIADGTEPNKLFIKASPRDDMPNGSNVSILIRQDTTTLATATSTPLALNDVEASITTLASGQNHTYQIDVGYQAPEATAAAVRTYELVVMKSSEGAADGVGSYITYNYNGSYQTYTPQGAGWYLFEAWGANGGDAFIEEAGGGKLGGKGGYASGKIYLNPDGANNQKMPLYIYVGGKGGSKSGSTDHYSPGPGGWNGGGRGGESISRGGAGGGGATSVSTVAGNWNSIPVLANRILVAGGGGGASSANRTHTHTTENAPGVNGSLGGGISGSSARTTNGLLYGAYKSYKITGESWLFPDTFAPAQKAPLSCDPTAGVTGQGFGVGGYGREGDSPDIYYGNGYNGKGGGGGGWWGGRISLYRGSDDKARNAGAGGGGGSNYISGYSGCYAVDIVTVDDLTGKTVVNSKANAIYSGTGAKPSPMVDGVHTSPNIGEVQFYDGVMNAHYTTEPNTDPFEPKPESAGGIFNTNQDGNGRLKITFLGGSNPNSPPSQ